MVGFRAFPQFNSAELKKAARVRHRVDASMVSAFAGKSLADRLARSLAAHRAVSLKEMLESFEFHARTRKRVRTSVVADICCGHGLAGLLFATEKQVDRVILLDWARPASFDLMLEAVSAVVPEVRDKVGYEERNVDYAAGTLPPGTGVVGVHACRTNTDRCIDAGVASGGTIAVMPCCHPRTPKGLPPAVRKALGPQLSVDVHRTYRLEAAGYLVDWSAIPEAITPMNRILVATQRSDPSDA
jgi:hypothetical protein